MTWTWTYTKDELPASRTGVLVAYEDPSGVAIIDTAEFIVDTWYLHGKYFGHVDISPVYAWQYHPDPPPMPVGDVNHES